jgi:hypothetical protein
VSGAFHKESFVQQVPIVALDPLTETYFEENTLYGGFAYRTRKRFQPCGMNEIADERVSLRRSNK